MKKIGTNFGAHSETQAQPKKNPKKTQKIDPLPPHLRGPNNAPPKNEREV